MIAGILLGLLLIGVALGLGALGAWLWEGAGLWSWSRELALWSTRRWLQRRHGYTREEAEAEVQAAVVRLGWRDSA